MVSDNSNPEFAMAGDAITITLQVSEQIETSTLQILNTNITMSVNNNAASATITVLENSTNGPVEFNITAYDKTGNVFNVTPENITGPNVEIDTINPSLADLTIYSNNANTSLATVNNVLSITITANETSKLQTLQSWALHIVMSVNDAVASADVTVSQNSAEGEVLFNITAFDLAGNNFTADHTQLNSSNVTIDHSIPGVENLNVSNNWQWQEMQVTLQDVLALLLYMVRSARDGLIVSISTLGPVIFSGVTLNTFPVLSYAVMVNSKGPFVEFSKTVMDTLAALLFTLMVMLVFRICRVEVSICSDTCKVTVIASPAIANSGLELSLTTFRLCTPGMLLVYSDV